MSPAVIARSQKQPPYQPVPSRIESCPEENSPHVCAEGFSVYYRLLCAVKDVSLAIPRGKVTAIIGPSGCGKSTFLRAINRMNDLIPGCRAEGRLLLEGQNVYDSQIDVTALRQRVGMIFQRPNPFPKSVFDNVAFGPRIHGVRRKAHLVDIVERSLRRAALWDEVRDKLHTNGLALSGGQQQRLCIARAIALQPDILLMDEPCSALDPLSTARIEELINEIKARLTVVLVTHNMQQAARVSDYTAFMYMGELVEFDTTDNIFTRPQNPRTQDYVTGRFG